MAKDRLEMIEVAAATNYSRATTSRLATDDTCRLAFGTDSPSGFGVLVADNVYPEVHVLPRKSSTASFNVKCRHQHTNGKKNCGCYAEKNRRYGSLALGQRQEGIFSHSDVAVTERKPCSNSHRLNCRELFGTNCTVDELWLDTIPKVGSSSIADFWYEMMCLSAAGCPDGRYRPPITQVS